MCAGPATPGHRTQGPVKRGRFYTAICTATWHPRDTTVRAADRRPGSGPTPDVFSGRSDLLLKREPHVSVTDPGAVTTPHYLRPTDESLSLYEFVASKYRVPLKVSRCSTAKCQRFMLKSPTGNNLLSSAASSKVPREKLAWPRPPPMAPWEPRRTGPGHAAGARSPSKGRACPS